MLQKYLSKSLNRWRSNQHELCGKADQSKSRHPHDQYVWWGEVVAGGEGARLLGLGASGTFQLPKDLLKDPGSTLNVRLLAINANGKAYELDRVYRVCAVTILALDTTSERGSIALRFKGKTVCEITVHAPQGFAHLLFPAIEKLRNEAKFDLNEVDCFAAATGPGSFTGLRVALAAVKGLAESTRKPVSGVSNLRALSSFGKNGSTLRAVTLDARRNEVYAAVYDPALRLVVPETVGPLEAFLSQLDPSVEYEYISEPSAPLASAVALCAELDGMEGKWQDPATLDANYVRRSDAELFWSDR